MKSPAGPELLKSGINAIKAGEKSAARELFFQLLESDQRNEEAWFLLSDVVDNIDDRRICLENVLVLNPQNENARQRLEAIEDPPERDKQKTTNQVIKQEVVPLTPAAAILYPERLETSWHWRDELSLNHIPEVKTSPRSQYSDVWEEESEICAYCASPLNESRKRCPNCNRKISFVQFAHPKTSNNFVVYWALVLAVAQLFFIQLLLGIILGAQTTALFWHGLFFAAFAGLTLLLVLRHPAGYVGSILLLLIVLTWMIIELFTETNVEQVVGRSIVDDYLVQLADAPYITLISPILKCVRPFQMITIGLALIFGILFVGTDFEKSRVMNTARVDRGINEGTEYYGAGKQYSEKGMWASAVLHYQRAVAREPNRAYYQWALGNAYSKLDFYARALDVLESARRLSTNPELTTEIEAEIKEIKNLQNLRES
jgi:tetratricopeptide (TPR) repeat protein